MVACVEGPTRKSIEADVCHYAVQYAQDGPVRISYPPLAAQQKKGKKKMKARGKVNIPQDVFLKMMRS